MLEKLSKRAQIAFAAFHTGSPHCGTLAGPGKSDELDELEILGGCKRVITSKSSSNFPASNGVAWSADQQLSKPPGAHGDKLIQLAPSYEEIPPSQFDYYNTLGHPRTGAHISRDFDMTPSPFAPAAGGYREDVQRIPGAVGPFFQRESQAYMPEYYLPQENIQASIHQPQHMAPIDVIMTNKQTQDDIWRDFMGHLGLTKPISE
jgi:hypothetical protein